MDLKQYRNAIGVLFAARVTPLVWGYHGIGKSTGPQQFADEGGHKLVNFRLGNVEAGELLGLQSEVDDLYNPGKKVATRNLMPEWLKDLITFCQANPDKYGILHLDEINHIRKDMQSFVFQMSLDHKLHETVFPPNLHVICSANPPTDDYSGVFDFSNKALLSRFCHIKLQPSVEEWLDYARGQEFDSEVIDYIALNPSQLDPVLAPFSIDEYANRNRRSMEFVSRFKKLGASDELLMGLIGSANVIAFNKWKTENKEKSISGEDILNNFPKFEARIKQYRDEGKLGVLSQVTAGLAKAVEAIPESGLVSDPRVQNVSKYIQSLPPDLGWAAALQILMLPAGAFGPNKPTGKEPTDDPGSVWGPHTCQDLYDTLKAWKTDGVADRVTEQQKKEEEAKAAAEAKAQAKPTKKAKKA